MSRYKSVRREMLTDAKAEACRATPARVKHEPSGSSFAAFISTFVTVI